MSSLSPCCLRPNLNSHHVQLQTELTELTDAKKATKTRVRARVRGGRVRFRGGLGAGSRVRVLQKAKTASARVGIRVMIDKGCYCRYPSV